MKETKENKMKKTVKNIKGIKIDVRSKESLYVTMKDWTVYIDNSTNEKIINSWKERKI
jgi:hypothetical protein